MNCSFDGFNERTNYIHNSNNMNRLRRNGPSNIDNSFAKMRIEERRNLVETTNQDKVFVKKEVRGTKDNFIIRNSNMNRINSKSSVSNDLRKNMFKR